MYYNLHVIRPFSYTMHSPCSHQMMGDVARHSVAVPQWHTHQMTGDVARHSVAVPQWHTYQMTGDVARHSVAAPQ